MKLSPVTKDQMKKVVKALVYSFVSGSLASFALLSVGFMTISTTNPSEINNAFYALIVGSGVGGINAALVYLKKLAEPS